MKSESDQVRPIGLNELGQITLRGNVAFAVRCAERMRPCFKVPADAERKREKTAAVEAAIRIANAFCRGLPLEPGRAAVAVRPAIEAAEETGEDTCWAAYAAVRAVEAVAHAERVTNNRSDDDVTEVIAAAFGAGRVVAANVDSFSLNQVVEALRADVDKLLRLAGGSAERLGPEIDPSENGPLGALWPAGIPLCYQR
jgi:hypothetical protein